MGDLPGLKRIYDEHYAFIWRVMRRWGVPESAVDDAVQEVFVVLHRRRADMELAGSLRGLLYGIARKVAKRQRPRADRIGPPLTVVADVHSESQDARVESRERARVLTDALDAMTPDKRMTFVLADIEGLSMPEVARCQNVNLNTAYARLRSARMLVQKAIARHKAREAGELARAAR